MRSPHGRVPAWAARALRAPAALYDVHLGWLLGHRFLRLTHVGRRTGRRHRTVLEVLARDPGTHELVVMAGLGRRADWFRNVEATPPPEVAVCLTRFRPEVRVLSPTEAATVLADYERAHPWARPLIHRTLSWLLGWRYDGSAASIARLSRERPLVGFTPAPGPAAAPR